MMMIKEVKMIQKIILKINLNLKLKSRKMRLKQ